jgi:hypothetical protein
LLLAMACTASVRTSPVALRQLSAFQATGGQPRTRLRDRLAVLLLDEQRELTRSFISEWRSSCRAVFAHPLIHRKQLQSPSPEILGTSESKSAAD